MKKYGMFLHLLLTGLVGFVFAIIGEALFPLLADVIWPPLGIAIYLGLFAAVIFGMSFLMAKLRGDYDIWQNREGTTVFSTNYKKAAIFLAVIFVASGVFEFIYEIDMIRGVSKPSSYVFLIDDSASMDGEGGSDPEMKRVDAISEIMEKENKNFEFAIYRFNSKAERIRDMAPYIAGEEFEFSPSGSTDIVGALRKVVNDIVSGELKAGNSPRILLLSDGYADSLAGLEQVIDDCNSNKIVVSSIGYGVSNAALKRISSQTGGVYSEVKTSEVSELGQRMRVAITSTNSRNLLSDRFVISLDILYIVLRVVFLILIGVAVSWIKQKCYCSSVDHTLEDTVFFVSIALCSIGAILVEVLFKVIPPLPFLFFTDFAPKVVRCLFCVLWAITPGYFLKDETKNKAK